MPLQVSSTCAHYQEVKISLYNLWYHHSYRWPCRVLCVDDRLNAGAYAPAYQTVIYIEYTRRPPIGVMIPEVL